MEYMIYTRTKHTYILHEREHILHMAYAKDIEIKVNGRSRISLTVAHTLCMVKIRKEYKIGMMINGGNLSA